MKGYHCELWVFVQTRRGEGSASRLVWLPFVPAVGMELAGLLAENEEVEGDGEKIIRVVWRTESRTFLVVLNGYAENDDDTPPEEIARIVWGDGWDFRSQK